MDIKRLSYEDYIKRLTEEDINNGLDKAYLPNSLKNNTAEFYLINNEEFWFFKKENNEVELSVWEKAENSIFDNQAIMEKIFDFLQGKGYKKVVMSMPKDEFSERHSLMLKYGFTEKEAIDFEDGNVVIYYEKTL